MKNFAMCLVLVCTILFSSQQVKADLDFFDWLLPGSFVNNSGGSVIVYGDAADGTKMYHIVGPGETAGGGSGNSSNTPIWDADFVCVDGLWYKIPGTITAVLPNPGTTGPVLPPTIFVGGTPIVPTTPNNPATPNLDTPPEWLPVPDCMQPYTEPENPPAVPPVPPVPTVPAP